MVSDEEIARGVESLLRQSDPNSFTSLNVVVQQLESKLGLDLSHKAGFIRDQISLLLRSHPQPQPQVPKDHFAFHSHPQYPTALHPQQFPSHFALHPYHQRPTEAHFQSSAPSLQPPPPRAQVQAQTHTQTQSQSQTQTQTQIQTQTHAHPQPQPPVKPEVIAQSAATVAPEATKERF